MPLQIRYEYATLGPISQPTGSAQSNQQPLIYAQHPSPYFASNEFTAQASWRSWPIQPSAQSTQLMSSQQCSQHTTAPPPYGQPPPQSSYIQPAVNQQQQFLFYAPSIQSTQQPFYMVQSFSTYPAVPNYNSVPSGITYYPPQVQPLPILSQRRPTNAIPILAPSERFAGERRNRQNKKSTFNSPIGSPENIDHQLDNMFTQRSSPQRPSSSSESNHNETVRNVTTAPTFDGGNNWSWSLSI